MVSLKHQTSPINYGLTEDAWAGFLDKVRELIITRGCRTVCEIGGGANPALPLDFVQQHRLDYVIIDVSATELAKAPAGYRTRVQDVTGPIEGEQGTYDLVFSKMLAEHVKDGEVFHRNMHALLKPGGVAFHFFPTLYAPPYVLNLLLPERLTYRLLTLIQTGRENHGNKGKFPAHYRWCRGPTKRQLARLEAVGFHILNYTGFYGHAGYYKKMPMVERAHLALSRWLLRHPTPWLTSFAYAVLEKRT
jgi:SAM-dependent methyltransferase